LSGRASCAWAGVVCWFIKDLRFFGAVPHGAPQT